MKYVPDEEFRELKRSVERIEAAVAGDEKAGIEGIGAKVNRNRRDINTLQRLAWIATGICVSGGTIFGIYKFFVK